jgi:hypothetical protein
MFSPTLAPLARTAEDIIKRNHLTPTIFPFAYTMSGNPEYDRIRKVETAS